MYCPLIKIGKIEMMYDKFCGTGEMEMCNKFFNWEIGTHGSKTADSGSEPAVHGSRFRWTWTGPPRVYAVPVPVQKTCGSDNGSKPPVSGQNRRFRAGSAVHLILFYFIFLHKPFLIFSFTETSLNVLCFTFNVGQIILKYFLL